MPSIREALDSAITAEETKDETPIETHVVQETSTVEEASRVDVPSTPTSETKDESAEVKPDAPTGAAKPVDAKPIEAKPQTPEEKETARQHRIDRAPQSWKKEAKGEWAALPLHIRQ